MVAVRSLVAIERVFGHERTLLAGKLKEAFAAISALKGDMQSLRNSCEQEVAFAEDPFLAGFFANYLEASMAKIESIQVNVEKKELEAEGIRAELAGIHRRLRAVEHLLRHSRREEDVQSLNAEYLAIDDLAAVKCFLDNKNEGAV